MKRPNSSGHHRAQSPARASNTTITAMLILAIIFLCALICWEICTLHKIAGGTTHKVSGAKDSDPASTYLTSPSAANTPSSASSSPVHILHDEPLLYETAEGGGGIDEPARMCESKETSATSPPAPQRSIWTTNATAYIQQIIAQQEAARGRADLVARIDAFLANSPLAGLSECMVVNQERTTVSAKLCAAVAYAESSLGRQNLYPYNAWGMYGVHPSSWEDGVTRWFDNCLKHPEWSPWQTGYDIQNPANAYCVLPDGRTPSPDYAPNVTGLEDRI